jgi:hypothetical protein
MAFKIALLGRNARPTDLLSGHAEEWLHCSEMISLSVYASIAGEDRRLNVLALMVPAILRSTTPEPRSCGRIDAH